jgi:hypothetical protein
VIWVCPRCSAELGELNGWCEYCKQSDNIIVYNPDKYYIRKIRIRHISQGDKTVTPQEELFAELFNHEKILVKDMDILELRAHREELAKIAFEARARLTAVDDEDNSRKKSKSSENKPSGFERSLNVDDTATDAINTIRERQKRLTKSEKIQAGLEKLGISASDASKLMSAGAILGRLKSKQSVEGVSKDDSVEVSESKPIFNPFEKKENQ